MILTEKEIDFLDKFLDDYELPCALEALAAGCTFLRRVHPRRTIIFTVLSVGRR